MCEYRSRNGRPSSSSSSQLFEHTLQLRKGNLKFPKELLKLKSCSWTSWLQHHTLWFSDCWNGVLAESWLDTSQSSSFMRRSNWGSVSLKCFLNFRMSSKSIADSRGGSLLSLFTWYQRWWLIWITKEKDVDFKSRIPWRKPLWIVLLNHLDHQSL